MISVKKFTTMSPKSRSTSHLRHATPIGQDLYLYEPSSVDSESFGPELIILCTWLGGSTARRINKYIDGYVALYPNAALLVITTKMAEITVLPSSVTHLRLQPARNAIHRIVTSESSSCRPSVLLHIFSHGGCNTAIQLLESMNKENMEAAEPKFDVRQHLGGVIFDCCPGDSTFSRTYGAMAASLPDYQLAKAIGKPVVASVVGLIGCLQYFGLMGSIADLRRDLNDPKVFGQTAKRLYLYSLADQMVQWEDVESHLEEAKTTFNYTATGISFPGSAHCALVREHGEKYWTNIQELWVDTESTQSSEVII